MAVDMELTRLVGALHDRAEAMAVADRPNLEAALNASVLMVLEASVEDGVQVDTDQLSFVFGVSFDAE